MRNTYKGKGLKVTRVIYKLKYNRYANNEDCPKYLY